MVSSRGEILKAGKNKWCQRELLRDQQKQKVEVLPIQKDSMQAVWTQED